MAEPCRPRRGTKVAVATQLQLTWWRFRKHKVALVSAVIVILFYLVAALRRLPRLLQPARTDAARSYIPPQPIHWFDDGSFRPHVYALKGKRDPRTFKLVYAPDPNDKRYLQPLRRTAIPTRSSACSRPTAT